MKHVKNHKSKVRIKGKQRDQLGYSFFSFNGLAFEEEIVEIDMLSGAGIVSNPLVSHIQTHTGIFSNTCLWLELNAHFSIHGPVTHLSQGDMLVMLRRSLRAAN